MYTNIRSVMNRSCEVEYWLAENKAVMVALPATWLQKGINNSEFTCLGSDRVGMKKG